MDVSLRAPATAVVPGVGDGEAVEMGDCFGTLQGEASAAPQTVSAFGVQSVSVVGLAVPHTLHGVHVCGPVPEKSAAFSKLVAAYEPMTHGPAQPAVG